MLALFVDACPQRSERLKERGLGGFPKRRHPRRPRQPHPRNREHSRPRLRRRLRSRRPDQQHRAIQQRPGEHRQLRPRDPRQPHRPRRLGRRPPRRQLPPPRHGESHRRASLQRVGDGQPRHHQPPRPTRWHRTGPHRHRAQCDGGKARRRRRSLRRCRKSTAFGHLTRSRG
ncbi:MAG: hypothetical protein RL514_1983 [Verrucomicrobiota bacterium]